VPIIRTNDTGSSELGKLMCNAMLAQRISAINSVTALCEQTAGCDIRDVKEILSSDSRIGSKYLQCSPGFGGSCFEKDL
jgi:UDPglucose 6-dehydrogenase